jgi:hypothetical protein
MNRLIALIFITVLLLSCNKEEQGKPADEAGNGDNGSIHMTDKDIKKPSTGVLKGFVKPEDLAQVLPESFNNFEKYPPSTGASYEEKESWTTASADYLYTRRSQINIAIFDYRVMDNIPNKELFDKPPKEEGTETLVYDLPNGKAYSIWNGKLRTGSLKAKINNRFVVEISAKTLPANTGNIKNLFDKIDLMKLTELENKAKNQ